MGLIRNTFKLIYESCRKLESSFALNELLKHLFMLSKKKERYQIFTKLDTIFSIVFFSLSSKSVAFYFRQLLQCLDVTLAFLEKGQLVMWIEMQTVGTKTGGALNP